MSLIFYAVKTRSGERQARLPLTVDGDLGTTIATYSSATFTLDTNAVDCPANYQDYMEPMLYSIVAVEEDARAGYSKPIWFGLINDTPISSNGSVKIATASLEWYLSTRRAKDARFDQNNDIMDIPKALIAQVEADGVGVGLAVDCPRSGVPRYEIIKTSDGQSVVDVFNKLAIEWTIAIDWADSTQSHVTKTFKAREPFLGKIVADHPDVVITAPGNLTGWDYTAPMTQGKTATYIVAEGDGSGDTKTTSVPKVDTVREAAGYPRIEIYQQFQGITNVHDADALADQLSQDFFSRTHVITGTVANKGATAFRRLEIGSSVRVIINDPAKQLDEVWRFVGWTMSADGEYWKPTLARLGAKTKAFPRQPSPQDAGRALIDLSGRVSLGGYQDPLANGYTFPANADGKAFAIDPQLGFGSYDSAGTFSAFTGGTPVDPGTGTGTGSNPGSGTGSGVNGGWNFGSEGFDTNSMSSLASSFTLGATYMQSSNATQLPQCQNEGNLVFGTSLNNKAFTSKDYSTSLSLTSAPAEDWGHLDIYSGYLQNGQLVDWAARLAGVLSSGVMGPLVANSSANAQPSADVTNGTLMPYYVTKVSADFSAQPFAHAGWLYIPVLITIRWATAGSGLKNISCIRFLRVQYGTYKALSAMDYCPTAEIANTDMRVVSFNSNRSGSQVVIATTPSGGSTTSTAMYSGEFVDGDIYSDGFAALPPLQIANGASTYFTLATSSNSPGISLYSQAGELELGSTILPRTTNTVWAGTPLPKYAAFGTVSGRPVTIARGVSDHVVHVAMFDPSAATAVTPIGSPSQPSASDLSQCAVCLSYGGYIYGFAYGEYLSAKLIPA